MTDSGARCSKKSPRNGTKGLIDLKDTEMRKKVIAVVEDCLVQFFRNKVFEVWKQKELKFEWKMIAAMKVRRGSHEYFATNRTDRKFQQSFSYPI